MLKQPQVSSSQRRGRRGTRRGRRESQGIEPARPVAGKRQHQAFSSAEDAENDAAVARARFTMRAWGRAAAPASRKLRAGVPAEGDPRAQPLGKRQASGLSTRGRGGRRGGRGERRKPGARLAGSLGAAAPQLMGPLCRRLIMKLEDGTHGPGTDARRAEAGGASGVPRGVRDEMRRNLLGKLRAGRRCSPASWATTTQWCRGWSTRGAVEAQHDPPRAPRAGEEPAPAQPDAR